MVFIHSDTNLLCGWCCKQFRWSVSLSRQKAVRCGKVMAIHFTANWSGWVHSKPVQQNVCRLLCHQAKNVRCKSRLSEVTMLFIVCLHSTLYTDNHPLFTTQGLKRWFRWFLSGFLQLQDPRHKTQSDLGPFFIIPAYIRLHLSYVLKSQGSMWLRMYVIHCLTSQWQHWVSAGFGGLIKFAKGVIGPSSSKT